MVQLSSGEGTSRRITFEGGVTWLAFFLVVAALDVAAGTLIANVWSIGPAIPVVESNAITTGQSMLFVGFVWWVLRSEGVAFGEIGLSPRLLMPATVAVAGSYVAINALGIGLAFATENLASVGYHWTVPPGEAVVAFLFQLVAVAFVEELTYRGYLQTKVVGLLTDRTRKRIALGIGLTGVLFALAHVPRILTDGSPGSMTPLAYLVSLTLSGIIYGTLYEVTQNLYVPVLFHAAGNMPGTPGILFFDTGGWPAWATTVNSLAFLVVLVTMVVVYRRWGSGTETLPVWTGREDATATVAR
ncbi:CAAX protease self-immunity [Halomicrobium zhouii]|uniref:CAAX protease self-immunity n=1 Tax=Halomicrobium zhouii TaxID=767519 RepID=A0A1I6LQH8_9EURY|nr:type II CAAX endopeptidase family protein [Halomicrobium zhouii]SFS05512.1 CAAX protease self-immunity [Halomicrobium zhouii]